MTNVTTFPLTATLLAARDYAQRGWNVFPVHGWVGEICTCGEPSCSNPAKHPATSRGLLNASKDEAIIDAMWKPGFNVAIQTGPESKLFVVDVDGAEGETTLENVIARHGMLPPTLEATTARGRHIFFAYPSDGTKIRTRVAALGSAVDIRGAGGYVVAAPSQHASGAVYSWTNDLLLAEAPDWLLKLASSDIHRDPETRPKWEEHRQPRQDGDRWAVADVRDMLAAVPADLSYDEWLHIGMALHEGGYALAIWDEWSRRGEKYRPGDCVKRWGGFNPRDGITMGTLVDTAKIYGWKPPQRESIRIEDHPARVFLERIKRSREAPPGAAKIEAITSGPAPKMALMEGLIGETAKWIVDSAIKPQPELALLNVLAALGAIFGRRYASPLNTRTNVYLVGIAATGSGKDHSRRQIKNLMAAAGLTDLLGGDNLISASGVTTALQRSPSSIFMLDEFGLLMQSIVDEKGSPHFKALSKLMIELYSSSSSIYQAGQYADAKRDPVILINPNLCIYGTTTVGEYVKALKRRAVDSGELNRFIVVPTSEDYPEPRRNIDQHGAPEKLIEAWRSLRQKDNGLWGSMILPTPQTVLWGDCEDRIFSILQYEHEQMKNAGDLTGLWHRYRENVIKIAMILAIVRSPLTPVIRHEDLDFGESLLRLSMQFIRTLIGDYVAESQHEESCNDVMRRLRKSEGQGIRGRDLKRAMRHLDKRQFDAVITSLIEQERLEIDRPIGRGSPSMVYRAIKDE